MTLDKPTSDTVRARLLQFNGDKRYFGADRAIQLVVNQWPANTDPDHVLIKAVLINRLYSTSIYDIYGAANHIVDLNIDDRLQKGDVSLVDAIADMHVGAKARYNLSFASKYCAWHQPLHFQILDGLVTDILWKYKKLFHFADFSRTDLRYYPAFIRIVDNFRSFFSLADFSRKDIDKFLWLEAKFLKNPPTIS